MNVSITYSSMNFAVENSSIKALQISSNIDNLYITGNLILTDFRGVNATWVKFGESININYLKEDNSPIRSYSMKVVSYKKKSSEEDPTLINSVEIKMASSWLFDQVKTTTAYSGTVSNIIKEIIQGASFFKGKKIKIHDSSDISMIRYQLGITNIEFINQIKKYAFSDDSPMFAYMDQNENFYLKSWDGMKKEKSQYVATPIRTEESTVEAPTKNSSALAMYNYVISASSENNEEERTYSFCMDHTSYKTARGVKIPSKATNLSVSTLPGKKTTDFNWYDNPHDCVGISLHDSLKLDSTLGSANIIVNSVLSKDIKIGTTFPLFLPLGSSLYPESGNYILRGIDEIWADNTMFSKLYLTKDQ